MSAPTRRAARLGPAGLVVTASTILMIVVHHFHAPGPIDLSDIADPDTRPT